MANGSSSKFPSLAGRSQLNMFMHEEKEVWTFRKIPSI